MAGKLVKVSLSIPDAARFEAVLEAAASLGFRAASMMPRLGVATGEVPEAALNRLRALDGVGAVEVEKAFRAV